MNLRYESLRFGFANPDLQDQNLRIRKDLDLGIFIFKDLDSGIFIFKDLFCAIVLKICKDSLDS